MEKGQSITRPKLDVETSPTIGVPEYAGESNFATMPSLDAKAPMGMGHTRVEYHDGVSPIVTTMNADVKNSDTDLNIGASEENLSAKYKYPRNAQGKQVGEYSDQ